MCSDLTRLAASECEFHLSFQPLLHPKSSAGLRAASQQYFDGWTLATSTKTSRQPPLNACGLGSHPAEMSTESNSKQCSLLNLARPDLSRLAATSVQEAGQRHQEHELLRSQCAVAWSSHRRVRCKCVSQRLPHHQATAHRAVPSCGTQNHRFVNKGTATAFVAQRVRT